jgi:uncharacterized protein with von Willebrand factor type A (vWA) domain
MKENTVAVSLDKIEREAPELVSLVKKAQFSMQKREMPDTLAQVVLVFDFSGSMAMRYSNGEVQRLAERLLALATQLDDDGSVDVFFFESSAHYAGSLSLSDYKGGIDRLSRKYRMGSTDYAGAFQKVTEHVSGGKKLFGRSKPAALPTFAAFITDGAPNSARDAEKALVKASEKPIFWKMFSLGSTPIDFLQRLDDLPGRTQDNADYKHIADVDGIPDMQLFDMLLEEYPEFVASSRALGMIQ